MKKEKFYYILHCNNDYDKKGFFVLLILHAWQSQRIILVILFIVVAHYKYPGNTDYVQTEVTVSLSDRNPFEELVIPIIDDNEYEGSRSEVFFVQAQLNPNGQDSERVRIAAGQANVTVNIIDNEVKPGIMIINCK